MNPDKYTNDQELIELRLQLHHEKCRADNLWEVVKFERAERKRLEAENERLRRAGDTLVEAIQEMDVIIDMDSNHPEVSAWNAAKEGKPSV